MKSLEDTFRRPRTASSLKHKKTGLELKKRKVYSLIFSRHAKLQMLQRLLIVTAGIVGKLQLNRQVTLVAYIFQSLDNGSIITNTAAGRNISSRDRVVILTVDIEDTLTAQHVNSPFRIDMLHNQMVGIQLDAKIRVIDILQHFEHRMRSGNHGIREALHRHPQPIFFGGLQALAVAFHQGFPIFLIAQ
mgnify:CR=1 FL=1